MDIVTDYLYIGSLSAYVNHEKLLNEGITHIMDLTSNGTNRPNMQNIQRLFKYMHIPMDDTPFFPIHEYFEVTNEMINRIREMGGKVLVNCKAGKSRSATICIYHLMKTYNLSMLIAYFLLKDKRPIVSPNIGFLFRLKRV